MGLAWLAKRQRLSGRWNDRDLCRWSIQGANTATAGALLPALAIV